MAGVTDPHWNSVERWSPTLFLAGGGLLVAHAGLLGVQMFSTLTTPPDVFGPSGHLLALAGLFGLYPAIAHRTPWLARTAVAGAGVALLSWTVMTVGRFLAAAGIVTSVSDVLPGAFVLILFGSTILTYVLFGVATLRVGDDSRIGLIVLAPATLIVVGLVNAATTGVTGIEGTVIAGGLALSVLALGYTLRTLERPADGDVTAGDVTAG